MARILGAPGRRAPARHAGAPGIGRPAVDHGASTDPIQRWIVAARRASTGEPGFRS
jgi:hypothetical protein